MLALSVSVKYQMMTLVEDTQHAEGQEDQASLDGHLRHRATELN